ncbi:hypothetical protein GCM10007423_03020 [Dyadobacter endophyticus]|uniref:Uncharacterized protein n=1 Tax=Dyadobacter endophyticus TaxID=1749036 RepID=A0ABQ1YEK3_9BACT|nr:hypothetical protein [Dyadobacter endophyticus]GGH21702.1 hypothetical protein GCM10007423_03020 [Dyadobacter endophyticus]
MKILLKSLVLLGISSILFNCSSEEPLPERNVNAAQADGLTTNLRTASLASGYTIQQPSQTAWRLAKTLSVPIGKGFNIGHPYAITDKGLGDINWSISVCYPELKPVKVAFHNLGIVDISTLTPLSVAKLAFNQNVIGNAPAGSASWINYMPAKTIIACKTQAGKYYLLEIVVDNPLQINIYIPVRM